MGMMHRLAIAAIAAATFLPASAQATDQAFFESVSGVWQGPGEIVAGKYKGTKFNCQLAGTPEPETGIIMDGSCRVGVFTQPMKARILKRGETYTGSFLDGAAGKGLDIVSGVVDGERVVLGINRQQLDGAMVARLVDPQTMNVTISVKVGESMVPVIGMTMKRNLDSLAVGSVR